MHFYNIMLHTWNFDRQYIPKADRDKTLHSRAYTTV